ncbi:Zn-dependent oxidoreductase [Larsenimonas salina]|uniref:Zn-dependent oxidoreductase n=1 Tax=Larsenimonas salina TaxID=1295565 RepID=UPI002074363B|nr:Zn-dependent oxidoreductase [Larsenimonas salina]MCM5705701.1 Zn-dependent oxidoreductase [Larsenimonas salina]
MKVFEVRAPHEASLVERDTPAPAPGEVLVKVAFVGICGSDMHILHGDNAFVRYPRVIGHEFSGTVAALGDDVTGWTEGERVCVDPVISCGTCYPCRINRPNVCRTLSVIGVHRDGGFEQYVRVPAANLYRVPESIPLDQAALVEPYSIASNVLSNMGVHAGDSLLIVGAGVIGMTVLQVARALGIERITVADILDDRLDVARELGATHTINSAQDDLEARVDALTDGEGMNLIVDAACHPALLPQMVRMASAAGRLGLLGFSSVPSELVQLEVIKKELTLVGSRLNSRQFPTVIELLETGRLDASRLISHRMPFEAMPEALSLIEQHPEQTRKVLIEIDTTLE